MRIGRRSINTTHPAVRVLVDQIALPLAGHFTRRWAPDQQADQLTLEAAVRRVTRNRVVPGQARNFAAGVFGLNADEVPARAVATYLTQKGAFRRYGFCRRGSIGVMEELADVVRRAGGEVWNEALAQRVIVEDGRCRAGGGAALRRGTGCRVPSGSEQHRSDRDRVPSGG